MLVKCLHCKKRLIKDEIDPRFFVCPQCGIYLFEKWDITTIMSEYALRNALHREGGWEWE